jgi:hypothetical protein
LTYNYLQYRRRRASLAAASPVELLAGDVVDSTSATAAVIGSDTGTIADYTSATDLRDTSAIIVFTNAENSTLSPLLPTGVTWNSQAFTLLSTVEEDPGVPDSVGLAAYILLDPEEGVTADIVVTWSEAAFGSVCAFMVEGIHNSLPTAIVTAITEDSTTSTDDIDSDYNRMLILSALGWNDSSTPTATGTGQSLIADTLENTITTTGIVASEATLDTSGSTQTMSYGSLAATTDSAQITMALAPSDAKVPPALVAGTLSSNSGASVPSPALSAYEVLDASYKLVVAVGMEATTSSETFQIDSVTWNGVPLSAAPVSRNLTLHTQLFQVWYLDSPTPATGDIVITKSGGTAEVTTLAVFQLSGAANGYAAHDEAHADSGELNSTITVPGASHYVLSGYSSGSNSNLDPTGTASEEIFVGFASPQGAMGFADESADAGVLAYGWTSGAARISIAAVAFGPA